MVEGRGYTNSRVAGDFTTSRATERVSENADGLRGGVGFQYMAGRNFHIGAEYRYSDYEAGLSRHQAVATLGFRL